MAAEKKVSNLMMTALGGEDAYGLVMAYVYHFYASELHTAKNIPYQWIVGWDIETGFHNWKKVHVDEDETSIMAENCRVLLEKSKEANHENRRTLRSQEIAKLKAEGTDESMRKAFFLGMDQFDEDCKRMQWLKDRKIVYGW